MLEIVIGAYCIYFLLTIYTAFMQIDYVKKAAKMPAVLLESSKYLQASNYAV